MKVKMLKINKMWRKLLSLKINKEQYQSLTPVDNDLQQYWFEKTTLILPLPFYFIDVTKRNG